MNDMPLCSVVIVNFNGKQFLENCLSSVLNQNVHGFEVLLVDNGSKDGSAEFVLESFPTVKVVVLSENHGFAGGNNAGVKTAAGDIIVLLNNDTIVPPDWLETLIAPLRHPSVAIASSHVITEGIPTSHYERNGSLNLLGHNVMHVFREPQQLFYPNGASLAYKRALLGLPFDETYFAYSEDAYLGIRARFLGYSVVHVTESRVQHFGGGTSRRIPSRRITFLQERNRLLTFLLFFSPVTLLRMSPYYLLNTIAKVFASFVGKYHFTGVVQAYLWIGTHVRTILHKRTILGKEKHVTDNEVLAWMTARVVNGDSLLARVVNGLSVAYCKLVGLRTIETHTEARK